MKIRTFAAVTTALVCFVVPAFAGSQNTTSTTSTTSTLNGNGQIVDPGGQGQQQGQLQQQGQRQRQTATGGTSSATGGTSRATGGAGGAGGAGGRGGVGGAGGTASATIGSGAGGAGGTASATIGSGAGSATIAPGAVNAGGNNVEMYYGGNNVETFAPPGFGLPSFGGGQCATVGFGIAISPSGGGALGPAWESTNCRNYYIAVTLIQAGRVDQGMRLLAMITPEAASVMAPAAPAPRPPQAQSDSGRSIDLCAARPGWTATQLAARYPECSR